jgi:hypothetical protein
MQGSLEGPYLLSKGEAIAVFVLMSAVISYVPLGLQQARTVALVFSFTTRPAFATLMLCCSMASWIVTLCVCVCVCVCDVCVSEQGSGAHNYW